MDNLSAIATARDEGKEEGLAEGEHKKAIETAKAMLTKGLAIDLVSQCTGLSIEEVKELM